MNLDKPYFFCGIGGSGMLPLALIVRGRGAEVAGSDRTLDQGKLAGKFEFLRARGIPLFAQDGTGLTSSDQILVTSAAVEDTIPDVVKAHALGARRLGRAELLAELFNDADTGIAVGGTSGKSTVTGMIGWILHAVGRDPTVMNGAVMKNFVADDQPFASALVGRGPDFVSEVDESDGTIALYRPKVAVLNNISLDHKSLEELRHLFSDFAAKAEKVVLNLDDDETRLLAAMLPPDKLVTFSLQNSEADLFGLGVDDQGAFWQCTVTERNSSETRMVRLRTPGVHNMQNALAAIGACMAVGVPFERAVEALIGFQGLKRRFECVGSAGKIDVIDDFAHNPDKITATLRTARTHGVDRLLLFFQPHGYGPLRQMKEDLIQTFGREMAANDVLIMPDPVYYGGTTSREVGTADIVAGVNALGRHAEYVPEPPPERTRSTARLLDLARPGDRIIIMGARDDTLSLFAQELVERLS